MSLPFEFDFKNPDYTAVFKWRLEKLAKIRQDPKLLEALKVYYRDHPADFINDWGCTFDPRNVEKKLPAVIPFVLFDRQREWIDWVLGKWQHSEPGLTDKSRDMGLSWLSVSLGATLCLFNKGMVIGFGSRKEEYVDKLDSPKSLFYKGRMFLNLLPAEFKGSWNLKDCAPYMRIKFPDTGSAMSGEGGDNIGRGDRASIYFVDESAFLERPQLIEASLSQTTNCRQDISTHNGPGTVFHQKILEGKIDVFEFDWRSDPRKDEAWYQKQVEELDPVTLAQEVNRDPNASVEGVIIPSEWVQAAVDAHDKLGIKITGEKRGAFDVADEGQDKNAFCGSHGILIEFLDEWSGKGDDIFSSVEKVFFHCDDMDYPAFDYDADGLGAGVRGDSRIINERRFENGQSTIEVEAFQGSGAVTEPENEMVKNRKNKDFFKNRKAQAWWWLRILFQNTCRALYQEGFVWNPDEIISISSNIKPKLLAKLTRELSQPTYSINNAGKIIIDKQPDGVKSPNLADSVMMNRAPKEFYMPSFRVI